jgi:hypothetical protein
MNASFPKHLSLDGGRQWTRNEGGVRGYSSDDGHYEIVQGNGYVMLLSYLHEAPNGETHWKKRFATVKAAMEYAETM